MNSDLLQIEILERDDRCELRLFGELDIYSSSRLAAVAETCINTSSRLMIDLNHLKYIDSSGLSVLVWIREQARGREVELVISCGKSRVFRVLEITGLLKLFTFESARQDALAPRLPRPMLMPTSEAARGAK